MVKATALFHAFCDFLEERVQVRDLQMLRDIACEFLATGDSPTLLQFVDTGVSLIVILPLNAVGNSPMHAAKTLRRRRERVRRDIKLTMASEKTQCDQVFGFLAQRVATRSLDWLDTIFHEFCHGVDKTIREFIALQMFAINILPYALPVVNENDSATDTTRATVDSTPPKPVATPTKKTKRSTRSVASSCASEASASDTEADKSVKARPKNFAIRLGRNRQIQARLTAFEKKKPWEHLFHPDLDCPFDRTQHTHLVELWRAFWDAHARAVWERNFWSPISRKYDPVEHAQRKARQSTACHAFEQLMCRVYDTLGAQFFVDLDRRPRRHEGWWYRCRPVNIGWIYSYYDEDTCWKYVESQRNARFPRLSQSASWQLQQDGSGSFSMWSITQECAHILTEIQQIKAQLPAEAAENECADTESLSSGEEDETEP
ncbi:hypothetical protein Poli38472_007009 [Pythium oligandrum]|uniref:Uncharacterized protein n=1 Tax=Pythium oligandrum TaxID=41045 RepID=A0A8K1C9C7_PYTOL|nr:hypothetical protein Poli38472_007009 [Pythium oligandrum]|eukprot:TMW58864.1 hypothetical protein Poli38472_007009 [Pythium oligandrum]